MRVKEKAEQHFICNHGKSSAYWADRLTVLECFMDLQDLERHQSCRGSEQGDTADMFTAVPAE